MRGSGARLLWLSLLALAWLGPARGAGEGPGAEAEDGEVEEEEVADEALSDELGEEDGVLVLHEHNFARALREHRLLLVEFYAPWCGHCQALAPQFAQAAAILRNESGELRLAKVDAPAQAALAGEFGITTYPTLKLFRDGNRTHPAAYTGRLDAEGIVRWMRRRIGPSAALLRDAAAAAAFISSQEVAVVGFFKDLRGEAAGAFHELAGELVDVAFGVAEAAELFEAYGLAADTVCLFKFDEERADFPLDPARGLDAAELTRFIRVRSLELVMEFSSETSDRIFGAKIPYHMLLFLNKTEAAQLELQGAFREAAAAFRGEVLFVLIDVNGYGAGVLPFFGLTPADAPTLRFIKMETNRKYQMEEDDFSASAVSAFVQAVLDGKVKPRLLSAEPPEDWDTRPVKVLVGKTFEQVAFDETKNVFVKFYAPWCSHCKEMAAAWEELGERYKDHEDIVIAEMDATANELENITIHGYPTLHYFPAGPGRKMIEYKSTRDVETFSKFLENGGTLPEEPPVVPETPANTTDTEEPSPSGTAETRDEL
ncbi:protein disulfide-isomerase A2 [Struthio camelus]|uniref:protein disulfide-isomerase A2 n=1 Tax=Struthio camelus TaxID=8801 RepID=UPI003603F04E